MIVPKPVTTPALLPECRTRVTEPLGPVSPRLARPAPPGDAEDHDHDGQGPGRGLPVDVQAY